MGTNDFTRLSAVGGDFDQSLGLLGQTDGGDSLFPPLSFLNADISQK